jgi:hypothetical protein
MNSMTLPTARRAGSRGWSRPTGLFLAVALTVALSLTVEQSSADAQASSRSAASFPALSLSYSDAQGPGAATITPHGPDETTAGTAITLTISQHTGTFRGAGFVRQVDARDYLLAAAITGPSDDSYFVTGTLTGEIGGTTWRGRGRWSAVGNPPLSGEWHMAEWPDIQPPARPQLSTTVRLTPTGGSMAGGVVTLVALPDGETRYAAELNGLTPGRRYALRLHAGTPSMPSASFTELAVVTAGGAGRASAEGLARFRGTEAIPLMDIADGGHVLVVTDAGATIATGTIPALEPLG